VSLKSKKGCFLFCDLVEQFYDALDKLMEDRIKTTSKPGKSLKIQPRKRLEGWDFRDLATSRSLSRRVAKLNAMGYGWVDLSIRFMLSFSSGGNLGT
jgi:hypothetical protein